MILVNEGDGVSWLLEQEFLRAKEKRSNLIKLNARGPSQTCANNTHPACRTGVEHELMVQSRGGHSSIVTATLEHSKKRCVPS